MNARNVLEFAAPLLERFADSLPVNSDTWANARRTATDARAILAQPASPCSEFLGYCEARRLQATSAQDAEFWQRLAGSVRKAGTL